MYTISNIMDDINREILAHNMVEDYFSYRIVYFVNFENKGKKYYIDTSYGGLRAALENIIRENLSTTNSIVIAQTTVLKNRESICLQSRSYKFDLSGYFREIYKEERKKISSSYEMRRIQCG